MNWSHFFSKRGATNFGLTVATVPKVLADESAVKISNDGEFVMLRNSLYDEAVTDDVKEDADGPVVALSDSIVAAAADWLNIESTTFLATSSSSNVDIESSSPPLNDSSASDEQQLLLEQLPLVDGVGVDVGVGPAGDEFMLRDDDEDELSAGCCGGGDVDGGVADCSVVGGLAAVGQFSFWSRLGLEYKLGYKHNG